MQSKKTQRSLVGKNLLARPNKPGQSAVVIAQAEPTTEIDNETRQVRVVQKIVVQIGDIIMVDPREISAVMESFEEWASKWH